MPKLKPGDIFSFQLLTGEYIAGRLLLDVKQQCVRPRLLKPDSTLLFFRDSVLVEIYKQVASEPLSRVSEVLVAGIFVDPQALKSGAWQITGHEDVDPTKVEFPEALFNRGRHPQFVRGEVMLPIKLGPGEVDQIKVYQTINSSGLLSLACMFLLGRAAEIEDEQIRNSPSVALKNSDLRFNEHRSEIYRTLGEDENQSYFEFSSRFDYDIRRFYS